jgi:glycosyltransferase involved in cell wall biosynthesis
MRRSPARANSPVADSAASTHPERRLAAPKRTAIKVILLYPMDLLGSKEGGTETFIRGFIKHAPEDFDLEFVGVTSDRRARPPRRAQRVCIFGRTVMFRPMIFVRDENRRGKIPVSLRFTLALLLFRLRTGRAVLLFNRIEPSIVFPREGNAKVGFVHTDIPRQCVPGKTEVLWARWPRAYSRLERWTVRRFETVFSVSQSTLDLYRRRYPAQAGRLSFMPTLVDPDVFAARTGSKDAVRALLRRSHPGLPPGGPWVLFVGRLQVVKAPFRAVEGFREYLRAHEDGSLIIIGEGNLKERLAANIRRLGLDTRVFLLGDLRQEELALFYRAADVMLLTSHYEGMPCCVLEALGSGTPVITTDVGEVRRVVRGGRSGEIVDGEAASIAAAIGRVIGDPGTYAAGHCVESVADYTPEKVLRPVFEKIRELHARLPGES